MTPRNLYDPVLAFRVLHTFPFDMVNRVIDGLHQYGLIVKTTPSAARSIPGRGFGVSEKFLQTWTAHIYDYEKARLFLVN